MTKSAAATMTTKSNPAKIAAIPKRTRSTKRSAPAERPKAARHVAATPTAAKADAMKAPSKREQLAALLVRDQGASLNQMIEATGWLPHTTRAALTGLKKKGYAISSDKIDGLRTYRAVAPQ